MSKKSRKRRDVVETTQQNGRTRIKSTKRLAERLKITLDKVDSLASLRAYLGIKPDEWDVIIVSDGSGTTWEKEAGWGSVLIRNNTLERIPFHGGVSAGTNNIAEMMGVFWPLLYLSNTDAGLKRDGCRVHVVSDSLYVVNGIQESDPLLSARLAANRELWLAIHAVKRKGFLLQSHHIARDTIDLNKLTHDLANLSRRSQIKLVDELDWDIHQANPE